MRPFRDTQGRYDLLIPDAWDLKLQGGFASLAHGDAWIQLRSAAAASPEAGSEAGLALLHDGYVDIRPSEPTVVTVGGRAGRQVLLDARSKAGRPSRMVVLTAPISPAEELVLIGGGGPEDTPALIDALSALTRTMRFR